MVSPDFRVGDDPANRIIFSPPDVYRPTTFLLDLAPGVTLSYNFVAAVKAPGWGRLDVNQDECEDARNDPF